MTARIPLLYVIENERFGGGERAFAQLINGLDRSRYDVSAACLTDTPGSSVFTGAINAAASVFGLDMRGMARPDAYVRLKRIIRDRKIRIVHSQGARADLYSRLAARSAGAAAVSTVASPVEEYDVPWPRKAVYTAIDRMTGSYVERFVAVADHISRKLKEGRGVPSSKVVRIYNGTDTAAYAPCPDAAARTRAELAVPPGSFLAGTLSRLSAEKGLFDFISAAKILSGRRSADGRGIRFLIAGEGPLEKELKARVRTLGMEGSFIFTGFVGDVRRLLNILDVFVLPSFREGFPMSVLEAMSMEKPVAASDIEGVNECVENGKTGLLTPSGNGAALAGSLASLFLDKAKAAEMGRRGRERVMARFALAGMIKAHEALYGSL